VTEAYRTTSAERLGVVLDDVEAFVKRFVVLNPHQRAAVTLWIAHTHAVELAESTPYLSVTSALPRSGKSRLLEVLELVVRNPLLASNMSESALFRAVAKMSPTVLFDEIDAVFSERSVKEDLRGLLNAGYRRGAVAWRVGGPARNKLESYPVFGPKALAGIGELPATIRDRSIRIRLERRIRDAEPIDRFRRTVIIPTADELRAALTTSIGAHWDLLKTALPTLPDELDDRAQDLWESLLAVADVAGGDWPARARAAAIALSSGDEREDDTAGIELLRDLYKIFTTSGEDTITTTSVIEQLVRFEESPWSDWKGKPLTPHALGQLLRPYGIRTMSIWNVTRSARGYRADQFDDVFLRVLGSRPSRSNRTRSQSQIDITQPAAPAGIGDSPGDADLWTDAGSAAPDGPAGQMTEQ
jgi:hypothetical protein